MARIYVGNLPLDIRTKDIDDLFYKYGRIRDIDLKNPSRPPAFAFVSFDEYRAAEDAVRGRDGVQFEGSKLRVEISRGTQDAYDDRGGGRGGGGGGYHGGGGGGGFPPPRGGPPRDLRRSEYRVIISGLPPSCSWQDLKDHFRQAGDVIFTDVDRRGGGVVEFSSRADQEYAVSKLDDTEIKSPNDRAYIRVKKPRDQAGSRSRSRSRDTRDKKRSRSRSRSRSRDKSKSKSKSRSRRDSRSKSPAAKDDKDDKSKSPEKKDD